ncbi:WD domain G-beta repeat [Carpediemonas membranifera]|uniref:WD domain G-beta repeat n=1 Tax=Carpediemonas membranifera TaxID=201153 RepID=A0A8J6B437_9EUKA|nr:WD domain G-beta repeat [Carpediemonas membranifera]|eukprot:KAG9392507.1 WD domain G-beta repeat [Carpediemonas membranifera]
MEMSSPPTAIINDDGTMDIVDKVTGTMQRVEAAEHTASVTSAVFSPTELVFATSSFDKTLKLWDLLSSDCIKTFVGHLKAVLSCSFSPDGRLLASGSIDNTARLWEISTGRCIRVMEGHSSSVWGVAFSPDGSIIASCSGDRTVRLWRASTGESLRTLEGHAKQVLSLAFSPNNVLASGSEDFTVRLWDTITGGCLAVIPDQLVFSVAFSPDGGMLASGSFDSEGQAVKLWTVGDLHAVAQTRTIQSKRVMHCVAFSPDGCTLATGSDDCTVRLWDAATGVCTHTLRGHADGVLAVAFSPDGNYLVSCSADFTVRRWDLTSVDLADMFMPAPPPLPVLAALVSPDGRTLATADRRTIRLYSTATGRTVRAVMGGGLDGSALDSALKLHTVLPDVGQGEFQAVLRQGHEGTFLQLVCGLADLHASLRLCDLAAAEATLATVSGLMSTVAGRCEGAVSAVYRGLRADYTRLSGIARSSPEVLALVGAGVDHTLEQIGLLHAFISTGATRELTTLLRGELGPALMVAHDQDARPPLLIAFEQDQAGAFEVLLRAGCKLADAFQTDSLLPLVAKPAMLRAALGSVQVDVNAVSGTTALAAAARGGHWVSATLLLDAGADPLLPTVDDNAVLAVRSHKQGSNEAHAVASARLDSDLFARLTDAVSRGDAALASILLAAGAPTALTDSGMPPVLFKAIEKDRFDLVSLLLAHGADPALKHGRKTAVRAARRNPHLVQALQGSGCAGGAE